MFKLDKQDGKNSTVSLCRDRCNERKKLQEGVKVIDFGVGDPDLPTPQHIVEALKRQLRS